MVDRKFAECEYPPIEPPRPDEEPPMINRYEMLSILQYLDAAQIESSRKDFSGYEGQATWNIRMAKERLLSFVVADVAVEMEAV